ncbi:MULTISPECIES: LXG domain-containing protein [Bacillaceae]|uniref:LXG domain-containing protein n=1 Tax=Alkalicoccobacillus plakortidis TaxID=444060 RepID=A0A9D5I1T9_9BACI|nr:MULTISPECIES: T7SS effector LXG polymorphic toxin [Bacillaceae]KQL58580.1 hypothetical protein AN965_03180 [Alkalicoccobacillus plakortidis]
MKVLDVQEVMDAIDKIKISKQQDSDNIESLRASIQKIEQLETLQGKGGEALKDHFRRLHLPVLEAFHLLIRQYMEQLDRVKSNLLGFESSSAIVREEFLSGELKNGLDRIATTATEDANEIESIRTSISDILPLTPFSMEGVLRQVDRGKDHAKETIETLHALDEQNEALLAQAESTLREVTNVVSQVANWSSGGAILSAETLAEVDANVEALYANLVTEAIQMTPPDPFDLTGHESVMYQTALPLEFLYTGAYANIPGGLKAMSWYYMNQFPVSAMMNDEQAIQACVAPPIEQDVDEGGGWLNATFNFFKGVGSGAVNAVGDAVEGVVNLVTDPIGVYNDTVEFIGAIVDDPALVGEIATELWNAFEDDVINGDAQSRGEWTGYALGLIGTAVVGDKGVSKVANSGQLAKLGRIGGKDGYKTRHEIELRIATQTSPTRPSLRTSMSNTRTRGVQALNTYAQNMKMSATIATGQASLAVKGATGQVKNSLARGMDNLQTNLNGSSPALAPAGVTGNRVPYNAMDSRRIQQDVGAVKQEQLRKIEVGSGVKPKLKGSLIREYIRDIEGRTGRKLDKLQVENLKDALRKKDYTPLTKEQTRVHRREFNKVKDKLVSEWELNSGQKWPTYTEDIFSEKTGLLVRNKGDKYDAHHIIENNYAGDHMWWNVHPAKFPNEHQAGIHGSGSPARELFRGGKL